MFSLVFALYSDDQSVRSQVVAALGSQVSPSHPHHEIREFATGDALRLYLDQKGRVDLFILDGEAVPEGGMGLARAFKDEIFQCPPVLLLTGRPSDSWLASWSKADATVIHPVDPFTLANRVAGLLPIQSIASTSHA